MPAKAEDCNAAGNLSFMAYHKYSYDIFGQIGEAAATDYFCKLWLHGNNRFGYHYSYVAKLAGQTVAIMTCYPAKHIKKLAKPTIRQLFKIGKSSFAGHYLSHLSNFFHFSNSREFGPSEFYIATLSVLPEYRSMGLGAYLLRFARKLTAEHGCTRLSLHVNADNKDGLRFYQRNGFNKATPYDQGMAYYRMVYTL